MSGPALIPIDRNVNGTATEKITPTILLTIDAGFEIQEANVSIIHFINSTPVSFEELQVYPELESYLHGKNNDPNAWRQGWRLVKNFEGNLSQYNAFVNKVCGEKSRIDCNGGMLFEYHEQFYQISYQQYGTLRRNPEG